MALAVIATACDSSGAIVADNRAAYPWVIRVTGTAEDLSPIHASVSIPPGARVTLLGGNGLAGFSVLTRVELLTFADCAVVATVDMAPFGSGSGGVIAFDAAHNVEVLPGGDPVEGERAIATSECQGD